MGLPRPAGGSGYIAARKPARPCAFFALLKKLGLALRATAFYPSASSTKELKLGIRLRQAKKRRPIYRSPFLAHKRATYRVD
ncbi:hypothetical protein SGRA_0016 [Saprospira grandis str. Lewin]|uniref:Uncharacterized protein n=1 Tax=Saprospira grandis (strain Lewin) TaxID=984262 RepID=H6L3S6_SAPGL|nr:hypothetical protein SGRA_0016 [Saprospira grandis str. Lewin]